jgi:hypothetical protein
MSFHSTLALVYLSVTSLGWNHWSLGAFSLVLPSLGASLSLKTYIIMGGLGLRLCMVAKGRSSFTLG